MVERQAKVSLPVKITVAYRSSEAATKAMAGLVAGWREAGFAPTLRPIADNYFTAISDPALKSQVDVFWSYGTGAGLGLASAAKGLTGR